MEERRINGTSESFPMSVGQGPYSYAKNSSYQKGVLEITQEIIKEEIAEKLDIEKISLTASDTFCIADFGCSTGHNSFAAIQTILEAVQAKIHAQRLDLQLPEFQVFFNDIISNDFNTLFASIPPEMISYTAGVPGSFYGRLFPKNSLHFAYSSCSLNWLSKFPDEVMERDSVAWNNGRIHYVNSRKEVVEAYSAQFAKDMESFLHARGQELVDGGLMALTMPGPPDEVQLSETVTGVALGLLESCLSDTAKKGLASMEKVDTFNLPVYFPSSKEFEAIIRRQGQFNIERLETLGSPIACLTKAYLQKNSLTMRAVFDGLITKHFGSDFTGHLFDEYSNRVADPSFLLPDVPFTRVHLIILKRTIKFEI